MLRRLAQILIVLALTTSVGGHWAFLQTVAWAGMLASNLQRGTVAQAVSDTFDGEHPCAMCKVIKASRDQERQQDQQQAKLSLKLEFGPVWQTAVFTIERAREWVASADDSLTIPREGPPKPRPRMTAPTVIS
ncbi:MAG: hypothetical protein RLY20_1294 [Verrucomicrobiota bacterium]